MDTIEELLAMMVSSIDKLLVETSGRDIVSASEMANGLLDLRLTANQIQQLSDQVSA